MIWLRTASGRTVNGESGPIDQVTSDVPVGVVDGDLLLSLVTRGAGESVTPPPGWTQVLDTDPAQVGLTVFQKFAYGERGRWVFTLSVGATSDPEILVLVYAGVDSLRPVESAEYTVTAAGPSAVAPVYATGDYGELAVLAAANTSTLTYSGGAGYQEIATVDNGGWSLYAGQKGYPAPTAVLAAPIGLSGAGSATPAVVVVLRPSASPDTAEDVRGQIVDLLPAGAADVYDLEPGGDYYSLFQAVADALRAWTYEALARLRRELAPSKSIYKLPDWERLFGLTLTRIARLGLVPQRQAQVRAAWRAAAGQGSSIPEIQAAVGPLLGYAAGTTPAVVECDRSALDAANAHAVTLVDVTIPDNSTVSFDIPIYHLGGAVSAAGVRLYLVFNVMAQPDYIIELRAPDGTTKTWTREHEAEPLYLYGREFAGALLQGIWRLRITNGPVSDPGTVKLLAGSLLYVEPVRSDIGSGVSARHDEGGAAAHWGVYADPTLTGVAGSADVSASDALLQRMRQVGQVDGTILSLVPYPDVESGVNAAIPDRCIPV